MPDSDRFSPTTPPPAPADDAHPSTYTWALIGVIGLLGLVAVASAGNPLSIPLRVGRTDRLELVKLVTAIAAAVVLVALAFTIVLHRTVIARRNREATLRHTLLRALPVTAAVIAMLALMTIASIQLRIEQMREVVAVITGSAPRPLTPLGISDDRNPPVVAGEDRTASLDTLFLQLPALPPGVPYFRILLAAIVAALVLAKLPSWWRIRAARSALLSDDGTDSDEAVVHGAVISIIEAMLRDADPKTAIIGAYARLTETLAERGLGRLAHEGPMEHLRRVLTRVNVQPEPLRRLIHLFELARFSTYRLTSSHREQALAALHEVAADIATFSPQDAGAAYAETVR